MITILCLSFHFQFDAIAKYFCRLMTRKEISGCIITFSSCFTRWGLLLGFPFPRHPFPFSRRPISPRGSNAQLLDFNVVLSTSNTFFKEWIADWVSFPVPPTKIKDRPNMWRCWYISIVGQIRLYADLPDNRSRIFSLLFNRFPVSNCADRRNKLHSAT